jgi:hypothetical protein
MPTINQLPLLSTPSGADQIPVYTPNNGDARRLPISALLTYFQDQFGTPTLTTNVYNPTTGFSIAVPTTDAPQQWMLLQPAGTLATGTITLPLSTDALDGAEVLLTTTQTITALTIGLNGASQVYGIASPGTFNAQGFFRLRYVRATNSWYRIA